jgi:hypothetical protein
MKANSENMEDIIFLKSFSENLGGVDNKDCIDNQTEITFVTGNINAMKREVIRRRG